MTKRIEFPAKVKKAAFERSQGRCENNRCEQEFAGRTPEYDHILPDALYGEATLSNCMVLCPKCHRAKTKVDVKRISKANRIKRKQNGFGKKKAVIPGSKQSGWKKKMDGTVERRS